jgi:hypothetical protein
VCGGHGQGPRNYGDEVVSCGCSGDGCVDGIGSDRRGDGDRSGIGNVDGVAVQRSDLGYAIECDLGGAAELRIRLTILTAVIEDGDGERRLSDGEGSGRIGDDVVREIGGPGWSESRDDGVVADGAEDGRGS